MNNIDRIKKAYDFRQTSSGFLAIKKKETEEVKVVLPSSDTTIYFMFNEEFNKATIAELVRARKVIKITSLELYRKILPLEQFKRGLDMTLKLKYNIHQAV